MALWMIFHCFALIWLHWHWKQPAPLQKWSYNLTHGLHLMTQTPQLQQQENMWEEGVPVLSSFPSLKFAFVSHWKRNLKDCLSLFFCLISTSSPPQFNPNPLVIPNFIHYFVTEYEYLLNGLDNPSSVFITGIRINVFKGYVLFLIACWWWI